MKEARRVIGLVNKYIRCISFIVVLMGSSNFAQASEQSCDKELGKKAAAELVKRCLAVSPATRPPCHASNPCWMISAEIARGCGMLKDDKDLLKRVDFCKEYLELKGN